MKGVASTGEEPGESHFSPIDPVKNDRSQKLSGRDGLQLRSDVTGQSG
jgi:hypothetical protein